MDAERAERVEALLTEQQGVVARWQLAKLECSEREVEWLIRDLRMVHRGVYVTGHAPLTPWQRWKAATLTEPGTVLARWSAAALHGLRTADDDEPVHVLRAGSGGRRRYLRTQGRLDGLDVRYTERLDDDTIDVDGVSSTSVERTILDLCMPTGELQRDRLFRDAIRLKTTTRDQLQATCLAHRGERGVGRLRALLGKYAEIPIERTRSDAEVEALVAIEAAGIALPQVNIDVGGFEADLVDLERKRILELDGPQFHQFPERDAERNAAWEAAGFTVERRPTDAAYNDPSDVIRALRSSADSGLNGT